MKSSLIRSNNILFVAACLLSILIYMNTAASWFTSDDFVIIGKIAENGFFYSWGEDSGGFLRPVTVLSLMLDYGLWGFEPEGYHFFNILLNVLCGIAVYLITKQLYRVFACGDGRVAALFAGVLFLLLPSHTEPVSWITARSDLLATCFALFSLLAFLKLLQGKSAVFGVLSVLLLILGLGTKESVLACPFLWLIITISFYKQNGKQLSKVTVSVLFAGIAMLAGYLVLRKFLLGHYLGGLGSGRHMDVFHPDILLNLARYCLRVFIPPLDEIGLAISTFAILSTGLILAVVFWRKHSSMISSASHYLPGIMLLCFFVCLLPVLSLKIGVLDVQSERYLYLPGAFICIALVSFLEVAIKSSRIRNGFMILILVVSGVSQYLVNQRWRVASEMSFLISRQVAELEPATSVIVNLPDHYRGAYVFRNGIDMASTVFQGNDRSEVSWKVLHYHGITDLSERYSVVLSEKSVFLVLPDSILVFPLDPAVQYFFFTGEEMADVPCYN